MALLDRFRRPPHWKHEDPLVRIAGVEELPLDEQGLLIAIARDDADARVRRAAVKKVIDPAVLAEVARKDHDDGVREEAGGILRDVALGVFENTTEADSLAALALLGDTRLIVAVAEAAALESVRAAALARLDEPRTLGTVARRAAEPATRLAALARLSDPAEVCAVALKSEHKDVALAAVERLADREALKSVAGRAVNRAVARRARALLDALDLQVRPDAETGVPETPAVRARATRRLDLCRLAEGLAKAPSGPDAATRLAKAEAMWSELGDEVDEQARQRFVSACETVRAALAQAEAERAERVRVNAEISAAIAARAALCDRVGSIEGEDTLARLDEIRRAWRELPPWPAGHEAEGQVQVRRFEEASAACERRFARWLAARTLRERAQQTCLEAERVAESVPFPDALARWTAVLRAWRDQTGAGLTDEGLLARFSQAEERFRAREAAAREAVERQRQTNLERLTRFSDRVERLLASPQLSMKDAERALRDLRDALDHPPALPQKHDVDTTTTRLRALHDALSPKVQELRDIDEWQRWANAGIQEQLCRRVEGLADTTDAAEAARQLRDIQEEWRRVSLVPREKAQALWARFKAASDVVRATCDAHFAQQAEQRAANLARKEALCQQAEALAESSDWIRTAEAIKALQAEWKGIGPVVRGQEKAVWERFRLACDRFFTRRHDDLVRRKEEWAANLQKKQALCERIEALAESTDWEKGIEDIRRAQAEWKGTGPVRKTRADAIWDRFRGACDRFFERYRDRDNAKVAAARAEGEALCAELEALAPPPGEPVQAEAAPGSPPEDLVDRVQRVQARWRELEQDEGASRASLEALRDRFGAALGRVVEHHAAAFAGTSLDSEQARRTMLELCEKAEGALATLRPAPDVASSPAAILAQQLREALAANTIGGRAAAADLEAKWRAADEEVRGAQARWQTLGPVPGEAGRSLARRFQRACQRFAQQRDRELHIRPAPDRSSRPPRDSMPQPRRER